MAYKELVSPVLDRLDSEKIHIAARKALRIAESSPVTLRLLERLFDHKGERYTHPKLNILLGGIELDNPVGVGGGWDKVGDAVKGLHALGFSFVEVGSVLVFEQPGNPKPRQFMIGPGVSLNRLGFNSPGMVAVRKNLERYRGTELKIGVSIGKNKEVPDKYAPAVHAMVATHLYDHASYFVINVSSPNTPGLRQLQDKGPLTDIAQAVNQAMEAKGGRKPLFVKIAPDLTNNAVDDVIQVVLENGLTGIIATNTTINADIKAEYGERWRNEMGGLAGDNPNYRAMSTEKVGHIRKQAGNRIVIIGVGGIKDTGTALHKIKAGATAVQVVTAIRGEGPKVAENINRGLVEWMDRNGVKNIREVVGTEASKY